MNAPVSTTVIAIDVAAAGTDVRAGFDRLLGVARQMGFVIAEPGDAAPGLTLTLEPDASIGGAVRRLASALSDFGQQSAPATARAVAHYGVVFRSDAGGQKSYMGSAIRSAQSALRRAPANVGLAATRDFVNQAGSQGQLPFSFEALPGGEGLSLIRMAGDAQGASKPGDQMGSADPEFLQFLKKRLAEDLGPFAGALADNARRSTTTANELIAALGKEIDDAAARKRFETDVAVYIKGRLKGR